MLSLFVILVLVGSTLAQTYGTNSNYQQFNYQSPLNYGSSYGSNFVNSYDNSYLLNEIRALGGNITDLSGVVGEIDTKSIGLRNKNRDNSFYIDSVNVLVEEWTETITRQNEEIADLELQAVKLLQLWDDFQVLNKSAKKLADLKPLIEEEIKKNQLFVEYLKTQDQNQDAELAQVQETLYAQLKDVQIQESYALATEEQLALILKSLEEVKQVLNSEQAIDESLILTSNVPQQTKVVTADFGGRLPIVQWGVFRLVVSNNVKSYVFNYANNGYGSSYASNPYTTYGQSGSYGSSGSYSQGSTNGNTYSKDYSAPLNFPVEVTYSVGAYYNQGTREVNVFYNDYSTGGWTISEVGVIVTLAYKDNSNLVNYGVQYN